MIKLIETSADDRNAIDWLADAGLDVVMVVAVLDDMTLWAHVG